jgi:hypothetical protein
MVGFALVGMLAFSPADFDVDLGISLSLFADDIAHSVWYFSFYLTLNMPIVKGKMDFFFKKNDKFKEVNIIKLNYFFFFCVAIRNRMIY